MSPALFLRALERNDLRFVHELNNNQSIMSYWFEEPYESFDELEELYNKHIHDNAERRFVAEDSAGNAIGLVELIEIDSRAPGQRVRTLTDSPSAALLLHDFESAQGLLDRSGTERQSDPSLRGERVHRRGPLGSGILHQRPIP